MVLDIVSNYWSSRTFLTSLKEEKTRENKKNVLEINDEKVSRVVNRSFIGQKIKMRFTKGFHENPSTFFEPPDNRWKNGHGFIGKSSGFAKIR